MTNKPDMQHILHQIESTMVQIKEGIAGVKVLTAEHERVVRLMSADLKIDNAKSSVLNVENFEHYYELQWKYKQSMLEALQTSLNKLVSTAMVYPHEKEIDRMTEHYRHMADGLLVECEELLELIEEQRKRVQKSIDKINNIKGNCSYIITVVNQKLKKKIQKIENHLKIHPIEREDMKEYVEQQIAFVQNQVASFDERFQEIKHFIWIDGAHDYAALRKRFDHLNLQLDTTLRNIGQLDKKLIFRHPKK